MTPYFKPASRLFSDRVFYFKYLILNDSLNGSIVAIRNPYNSGEVLFRRLVANENEWI